MSEIKILLAGCNIQNREIKLKELLEMTLKKNRIQLLNSTNLTLKKIWKYVNTKTKQTERIGDSKVKNELGETIVCTSAKPKADSLCSF